MKTRLLLWSVVIALAAVGCKKDNKDADIPTPEPVKTYVLTEDFEQGSKGGYAQATVKLATGDWDFNDALIGNLAADNKNGNWSVRLRTGSLGMQFDVANVTRIIIKHAKYGADANSLWQLMISTDGGANYRELGPVFNETSNTFVTDSFTVTPTPKARFRIVKSGTTRINIDDITFKGIGDPGITLNEDNSSDGNDGGSTATPAAPRGVNVGADAPPASGDNSNLLMGNPSGAQASMAMGTNYLIDAGYYVESYNSAKGIPNWVSWHLDASNANNAVKRTDAFAAYSGLPTGFVAVQSTTYNGSVSGFDRGHNCPSADRTSSTAANQATFLMINMIPQAPYNNQQTWNDFEGYLRTYLPNNEVYIVMGNYGAGGTGSKGGTTSTITTNGISVTVPAHVWKVAVIIPTGNGDVGRVTGTTRVIAIDTPNQNSVTKDWKPYLTTVRAIEAAMGNGFNLLSALPQNVQDAVEAQVATGI